MLSDDSDNSATAPTIALHDPKPPAIQPPTPTPCKWRSPFKSPLIDATGRRTDKDVPNSLNLQILESKVQHLKRAIKIRAQSDDDILESLAGKWRAAGQEVALGLWAAFNSGQRSEEDPNGHRRSERQKSPSEIQEEWETNGSIAAEQTDEDLSEHELNVGKMLQELGIDAEVLGWDKNRCDFADE